jgi:hypothetical protein
MTFIAVGLQVRRFFRRFFILPLNYFGFISALTVTKTLRFCISDSAVFLLFSVRGGQPAAYVVQILREIHHCDDVCHQGYSSV